MTILLPQSPSVRITGVCYPDELRWFLVCLENYIAFAMTVVPNPIADTCITLSKEHIRLHAQVSPPSQTFSNHLSIFPSVWICLFETFYINRITRYGPLVPGLFHLA